MSRTITLTNLISRIRNRGDVRDTIFDDTVLTDFINESITELIDEIIIANPNYYLASSGSVSVVSGTQTYALPADFYVMRKVEVLSDTGKYRKMFPFNFQKSEDLADSSSDKYNARYSIQGSNLWIYPSPEWSGTVRLWYISTPTKLSAGGDTFDGIHGWEEYVVLSVVLKCKIEQEEETSAVERQLARCWKRIRSRATNRDVSEPPKMRSKEEEALRILRPWLFTPDE